MRASFLLAFLIACGGSDVSRAVGARCDTVDDCDDRCLGPSTDYPAGFCTVDCSSGADCPDGECVERDGGVCLFRCDSDNACLFLGDGWTCHEDSLRSNPQQKVMVCRG